MDKTRYDEKIAAFYEKLCRQTLDAAHLKAIESGRTVTKAEMAKILSDHFANIQSDSVLDEPTPEPEPEIKTDTDDDDEEK